VFVTLTGLKITAMKTIKGLATFIFFSVMFGACFSPPEFSTVPSISFQRVFFRENPDPVAKDSLVVEINFQDGDGDLGLGDAFSDYPYHTVSYYLANDGDTTTLGTFSPYTNLQEVLLVPEGAVGKLATVRTRKTPGHGYENMFPEYICPFKNTDYVYDSIYVLEQDAHIFDESTHNLFRTYNGGGQFPDIYVLWDTFAIRKNPYHFNINVDFLVRQNNDTYVVFDWKNSCGFGADFSARFPILTDGSNPLEGTLRYGMGTVGFHQLFDGKTIKLRIRIFDRALNASNVVESQPFMLQDIME
jgi:hypothetical protein